MINLDFYKYGDRTKQFPPIERFRGIDKGLVKYAGATSDDRVSRLE